MGRSSGAAPRSYSGRAKGWTLPRSVTSFVRSTTSVTRAGTLDDCARSGNAVATPAMIRLALTSAPARLRGARTESPQRLPVNILTTYRCGNYIRCNTSVSRWKCPDGGRGFILTFLHEDHRLKARNIKALAAARVLT